MTPRTFRARLLASALLLLPLASCDDPAGPDVADGSDLLFIREAADAPDLAVSELTFWARRGETREVRMPYVNGYDCLTFKVPSNALNRYPDGTAFRDGDSVRITIRVATDRAFDFEFLPSGLRFDSDHPAELRVEYGYRDPDTDRDGDVDAADQVKFNAAAFWRQETAGAQWMRVATTRTESNHEMRAELNGFTRYALASN
jgi:hypothetical protein